MTAYRRNRDSATEPRTERLEDPRLAERARCHVTRRLMPFLMLVYLLAYLDRANVGVAKLQMQPDLGFSDSVIGFGAGIFFFGYLLLDVPGSLIVEHWSARKWIARIMLSWGAVAVLTGFIGTYKFGGMSPEHQFYALRLMLGIAEAGFFPGVIVYLSHWFQLADRSRAKAYFMVTQPIAIALGVPLSTLILKKVHWLGWEGWRWVFILEGIPPVVFGVITSWYLTDHPHQAGWLAADEKQWLVSTLAREQAEKISGHRVSFIDALRYPQTLLLMASSFLVITGNQALIFFLPSITESMKDMPVVLRNLGAALPYACSAIGILLNGFWAQRTGKLRYHTAIPMIATGVALGLAVLAEGHGWVAMSLFCCAGLTAQAYLPTLWTFPTAILGKSAAAAAVGIICVSNLGGFVGPYLFGYLRTTTGSFRAGLEAAALCMLTSGVIALQVRLPHPVLTGIVE